MTLLHASCSKCSEITSKLEWHVLREMWGAARTEMGYQTRNKKRPDDLFSIVVVKNGVKSKRCVHLCDALKVILLPIFNIPAILDTRDYFGGIERISQDQFVLVEQQEDLARRLDVDKVCVPDYDPEVFARFVAKCSYGYAIARYGSEAFESIYVCSAILGKENDIGKWVGSPTTREFKVRKTPMSVGFKILTDNDVLVRIKMFPRFDGAEYVTVVGRMRKFCADQYRLMRKGREAPST